MTLIDAVKEVSFRADVGVIKQREFLLTRDAQEAVARVLARLDRQEATIRELCVALEGLLGALERERDMMSTFETGAVRLAATQIYAGLTAERMQARDTLKKVGVR